MDEAEDDEEVVADDEEEEEAGEAKAAPEAAKMPKWALNLDVGSIRLPAVGVINNDSSEGAAQLFDNAVLAKVMGMYRHYYRQRVLMTPEDYRAEMTTGRVGRLDLDGICPYTGEDDDGSLRRPTEEELDVMFRAKAKEAEWMQGEMMYGGRPRNMLMTVVKTLEIYEKLMERLVLAGFKPEDLQFLIPMNKMKGTSEEKNEMRAKMSSFLCRLLKSAFPNSTQYTYFRAGDHGFEDCLEIPAFAVYLSYREQERQLELLVTATQCNVNLPQAFIGRIAHASSVQNKKLHEGMYDGSTTSHQMSTRRSCRMSTRQLEAPRAQRELLMTSPKQKHERLKQRPNQEVVPRLKAPDHLRQKLRQQVPQATQAHHHLLQPAPQRPNLHQSRC